MALFTAPIESTEPIETGEMQVGFSDVDWTTYGDDEDDSTSTRLRIHVKDNEHERAERLASLYLTPATLSPTNLHRRRSGCAGIASGVGGS